VNDLKPRPTVESVTELPTDTNEVCDACPGEGTPARVLVKLGNGNELTFCQHDATKLGFEATS
jgi:hypothetical protein